MPTSITHQKRATLRTSRLPTLILTLTLTLTLTLEASKWFVALDREGRTYFYNRAGESKWFLPDLVQAKPNPNPNPNPDPNPNPNPP